LVVNPLADKKLILITIEVGALSFTLIIDPVAFKMISISLSEDSIPIPLSLVPLALVDISIGVDHSSFALGHSVDPVSVVSIAILEEESTSAVLLILEPITGILSPELAILVSPVSTLSVLLVHGPHALILVAILVELNTESFLAVVSPVTDISARGLPDFTLDGAILLSWLLFNPVHTSVGPVLLSFSITHFPEVDEWRFLLKHNRVLSLFIVLLTINTLILLNYF
tara:strand:- start:98 stop:778 length:681 start_codon:yes stop_codon:yes gene_type:complete